MMRYAPPSAPSAPTGVVRGNCDDHFFYTDTVNGYGYWESDRLHIVKAPEDGIYGSRNTCGPGATMPVPTVPVPVGASMQGLDEAQPSTEPWTHALMRRHLASAHGVDAGDGEYPDCCCADTHQVFRHQGAQVLAVIGGLVGAMASRRGTGPRRWTYAAAGGAVGYALGLALQR